MITLSVAEIYDLACLAGFTINTEAAFMPDADEMQGEIAVIDCPAQGLLDDDKGSSKHYSRVAYFTECPEEGHLGLGPELVPPASITSQEE